MSIRFLLHDPRYWMEIFYDHFSFPFLLLLGWSAGMLIYAWLTHEIHSSRNRYWLLSIHAGALTVLLTSLIIFALGSTSLLDIPFGRFVTVGLATASTFLLMLISTLVLRQQQYFPSPRGTAVVCAVLFLPLFVLAYRQFGTQEMLNWLQMNAARERGPEICHSLKASDRFVCEEELATDGRLTERTCRQLESIDNQILCLSRLPANRTICRSMEDIYRKSGERIANRATASTVIASCYDNLTDGAKKEFCDRSQTAGLGEFLVLGRCYNFLPIDVQFGSKKITMAMWYLSIEPQSTIGKWKDLPGWKEIAGAKPNSQICDTEGKCLRDYVRKSRMCRGDCAQAFLGSR